MDNRNTEEFELRVILRTIMRKWYIVLAMVVLGIVFSYYKGYYRTTTLYEAKTSLIVGTSIGGEGIKSTMQDVQQYAAFVQIYCALARTSFIAEKVASRLDNNISAEAIHSSVIVAPQESTQFIKVSITWWNPKEAVEILNTFNQVSINEVGDINPTCKIQEIEKLKEVKPIVISKKLYAVAAPFAGIIIGILMIFGIELFDNSIRTEEDVREYLNNISVIGEIPKEKKLEEKIELEKLKLPSSLMIEAFRTLRTNIEFITSCNSLKSIMVTSARPKEGKSTTAAMLACVIAKAGKRTILVDCDLRNPNVHKIFKVSNDTGLTNYLAGKTILSSAMTKVSIDNLYLMTSGIKPPNPTELLACENMKALMRILRNDFDYIVIDTPPVGLVTDAQVLAQITDGTIYVVSSGKSDKRESAKAKDLIKQVGGNIIGAVLNNIKYSRLYKGYSYYYHDQDVKTGRTKAKKQTKESLAQEE